MKIKSLLRLLLAATILFNSCSDDDKKIKPIPPIEFVSEEDTISLEGSRLYLLRDGTYMGTHYYRIYFLTDGFYTNGAGTEGASLDDYRGATYFLEVKIGVPVSNDLVPGKFPQHSEWNNAELTNANVGYFLFASGTMDDLYVHRTEEVSDDPSPITVGGGLDSGETMTVKFTGKMRYSHPGGVDPILKEVTGRFYFEGTVIDGR